MPHCIISECKDYLICRNLTTIGGLDELLRKGVLLVLFQGSFLSRQCVPQSINFKMCFAFLVLTNWTIFDCYLRWVKVLKEAGMLLVHYDNTFCIL